MEGEDLPFWQLSLPNVEGPVHPDAVAQLWSHSTASFSFAIAGGKRDVLEWSLEGMKAALVAASTCLALGAAEGGDVAPALAALNEAFSLVLDAWRVLSAGAG